MTLRWGKPCRWILMVQMNGANVTRVRHIDLIKMENAKLLMPIVRMLSCFGLKIVQLKRFFWKIPGSIIKQKVFKIYTHLKQIGNSSAGQPRKSFIASEGWLHKLKQRFSLHNIKLLGEQFWVDTGAVDKFKQEMQETMEEGGYCRGVYWYFISWKWCILWS